MTDVAAYIRVSTEKQRDEGSHENQRDRIADWVDRSDYDDVDFFEDIAVSGQSDNRREYERLMGVYSDYDAVVVRELSRFGRDPLTLLQDVEEIIDSETDFISISEDFDTTSAMGKAFIRLVAVINGMYADLRREQAIAAAERRRERGDPLGRPKKLDEAGIEEVRELREADLSYTAIARYVESDPGMVDEISRETIRRYCDGG